jgi:hypothetical protein
MIMAPGRKVFLSAVPSQRGDKRGSDGSVLHPTDAKSQTLDEKMREGKFLLGSGTEDVV